MIALFRPRPLVGFPHIFFDGQVLQVPRDMQATNKRMLERDNMINLISGRAVKVDSFDFFFKAGKLRLLDIFFTFGDIIPIAFRISGLPSILSGKVLFLIRDLPSLCSFVAAKCRLAVVFATSFFNGAAGLPIIFLPLRGTACATNKAGSVACLPSRNMPVQTWLPSIVGFEASGLSLFACYDFIHRAIIHHCINNANGAFIFHKREREMVA